MDSQPDCESLDDAPCDVVGKAIAPPAVCYNSRDERGLFLLHIVHMGAEIVFPA